jgi:hypothetical protein
MSPVLTLALPITKNREGPANLTPHQLPAHGWREGVKQVPMIRIRPVYGPVPYHHSYTRDKGGPHPAVIHSHPRVWAERRKELVSLS